MPRAWNRAIYFFYLSSLSWRDSSGPPYEKISRSVAIGCIDFVIFSLKPSANERIMASKPLTLMRVGLLLFFQYRNGGPT
jgi:hypothetical protein